MSPTTRGWSIYNLSGAFYKVVHRFQCVVVGFPAGKSLQSPESYSIVLVQLWKSVRFHWPSSRCAEQRFVGSKPSIAPLLVTRTDGAMNKIIIFFSCVYLLSLVSKYRLSSSRAKSVPPNSNTSLPLKIPDVSGIPVPREGKGRHRSGILISV